MPLFCRRLLLCTALLAASGCSVATAHSIIAKAALKNMNDMLFLCKKVQQPDQASAIAPTLQQKADELAVFHEALKALEGQPTSKLKRQEMYYALSFAQLSKSLREERGRLGGGPAGAAIDRVVSLYGAGPKGLPFGFPVPR